MTVLLAPRPTTTLTVPVPVGLTASAPAGLVLPPTVRLVPARPPVRWTDDPVTPDVPIATL